MKYNTPKIDIIAHDDDYNFVVAKVEVLITSREGDKFDLDDFELLPSIAEVQDEPIIKVLSRDSIIDEIYSVFTKNSIFVKPKRLANLPDTAEFLLIIGEL